MIRRNLRRAASDWHWFGLLGAIGLVWVVSHWLVAPGRVTAARVQSVASLREQAVTAPIETIRVGQRVLARNPDVTDAERAERVEPDWAQWLHVSLELPLASTAQASKTNARSMKIELLRPEAWLLERMEYMAQSPAEHSAAELEHVEATASDLRSSAAASPIPMREIFHETNRISDWLREQNIELLERCIALELPEMGVVGQAVITDIRPCPDIAAGNGQVVTATFAHPPSTQVLDVHFSPDSPAPFASAPIGDAKSLSLGVTENHPFWSVDSQAFVPIGELAIGQRVVTYQGEIKRIASKLPRPGPETVYNLEVYGEHVYFVGEEGLLAHNNCAIGDLGEKGAKEWLKRHGYTEVMQIQNRSRHGLDVVARHRDGTITFFEVKTSLGGRAPSLSEAQIDQATFIPDRLRRAADGAPWWRKTPLAVRATAKSLHNDLATGAKYRRYIIEITNATNSAAPTQFRILPWSP